MITTIDVNKELFRLAELAGLKLIDDVEYIKSKTIWLEDIEVFKGEGNKNYTKTIYYITLKLYEVDTKKTAFYTKAEEFLSILKTNLFENDTEHTIELDIRKEISKKVSTDVAKFYQYTIDFLITVYQGYRLLSIADL